MAAPKLLGRCKVTKSCQCLKLHREMHEQSHVQQLRQAEGHDFRHAQLAAAVEGHVEVDVHQAAAPRLQQDVVQVAVPQAQQVAHLQRII